MSSYPPTAKVREYYYDDEPENIFDPEKVESLAPDTNCYDDNFGWRLPNREPNLNRGDS